MKTHAMHCPITGIPETTEADYAAIAPLLDHLQANRQVAESVVFPRGTVTPEGQLDLCKQNIGPGGCHAIANAMMSNETIRALLLGTDGIGDAGASDVARLIGRNAHLEIVYLGCNVISDIGAAEIARSLTHNKTVTGLWLKRNPIGVNGAFALAEMLRHNRTLRTLDLVNTFLGEDGLAAILDALIHWNRTVERLYLGANEIGSPGAEQLAQLLEANSPLRALHLNVNDLEDAGAKILADALGRNKTLTALDLASNGITSEGAVPLLQAIGRHSKISSVDLGYARSTAVLGAKANRLGDEAIAALGEVLSSNRVLERIDLRGSRISEQGRRSLVAGLANNTTLLQLLIDQPDEKIAERLERNQNLQCGDVSRVPCEIRLIRSTYRTA